MAAYSNLRARYSKGALKLRRPLHLPEGTEVRVNLTTLSMSSGKRKPSKRRYRYPTRTLPWRNLRRLSGILSVGGDALSDSEALYD
jgi:predicted DNA-binding antitoxin AbrB/MazE fold protein